MATGNIFDTDKLAAYTAELRSDSFINYMQSRINYDFDEIKKHYFDYVEQAEFGVKYLSDLDLNGKHLLEIGSGAGILTAWLLMNGVNIVGIEPSALGFHFHNDIYTAICDHFKLPENSIYDLSAEELDAAKLGKFDIIFSINVMEHIPTKNLGLVFGRMKDVLNDDGIMYHHCPNYIIPFEPHYGIPLVPFFPQITGKLKGVADEPLWRSVNFITLPQVKQLTESAGLKVKFQKEVMKTSFVRLEHDKEFASRHKALAGIYKFLKAVGIIRLMGAIPPSMCTPMTFAISRKGTAIRIKNF